MVPSTAMGSGRARTAWREAGWLALTLVSLTLTLAFEHWVVHRQVILPSLAATGAVLPWMWGALLAPEMVVAFVAGWRVRGLRVLVIYALAAAVLREAFELELARMGEPGHGPPGTPISEFAFGAPFVAIAYFVLFAFASASGRSDEALDESPAGRR
jgi:hypothetical protein